MEIKVVDGRLSIVTLFAPVAVGYGIGAAVIFLPMFLLMGLLVAFTPEFSSQGSGPLVLLPMVIMVPLILVMQGVMAAGFVILGLAIFRRWGAVRVVSVKETIEP